MAALQALELVSLGKDVIRSAETIQRSSKNQFDKPLQRIRRQIVAVDNDMIRKLPVPNLANLVVTFTWAVEKIREVLLLDAVRLSLQETSVLETLEEINLILDETIIDCQYGVNDYIVGFDSNNKSLLRRPASSTMVVSAPPHSPPPISYGPQADGAVSGRGSRTYSVSGMVPLSVTPPPSEPALGTPPVAPAPLPPLPPPNFPYSSHGVPSSPRPLPTTPRAFPSIPLEWPTVEEEKRATIVPDVYGEPESIAGEEDMGGRVAMMSSITSLVGEPQASQEMPGADVRDRADTILETLEPRSLTPESQPSAGRQRYQDAMAAVNRHSGRGRGRGTQLSSAAPSKSAPPGGFPSLQPESERPSVPSARKAKRKITSLTEESAPMARMASLPSPALPPSSSLPPLPRLTSRRPAPLIPFNTPVVKAETAAVTLGSPPANESKLFSQDAAGSNFWHGSEPPPLGAIGEVLSGSAATFGDTTYGVATHSSALVDSLSTRGVTLYTLDELCTEIRATPKLAGMPISNLYRREIPSGVQHEFIMVRSLELPESPSVWIRIDRAAKGYREKLRLTTRYPADDTARMGTNEDYRLLAGDSRLRAHVEFSHPLKRPYFFTLADLLMIMQQESSEYRLLSENCYFFTSVIQELLTEFHGGEIVSGSLGHKHLGASARSKIQKRFLAHIPGSSSKGAPGQKTIPLSPNKLPQAATGQKPANSGTRRAMPTFGAFRPR